MLLFFFPVPPDIVVLFTLAIVLYLTVIELRELTPKPHYTRWAWWLLLVSMTHFVGYLALRGYAYYRNRSEARA